MKKLLSTFALCLAVLSASAQNVTPALENSKLADNWYISVSAGGITPISGAFFKNMRATAGAEIGRYLTPVFGLGLEDRVAFNTTGAKTLVDQNHLALLSKFNLSNLFGAYPGEPRLFEVVAVAGLGWAHSFGLPEKIEITNAMTAKAGAEFNFNLGDDKQYQINLKPAFVWGGTGLENNHARLAKKNAAFEFNVGFTYKFGNSYGSANFVPVKPYDAAEIARLNGQINDLRAKNEENEKYLAAMDTQISTLQAQLEECNNREPQVQTIVEESNTKSLESVVTFRQGRATVDSSQLPNVERIATFMKNHKESTVVIKGYASPEGSAEVNARIALQRAEAVRNLLVSKYGIAASRIQFEGQGVGNMFSEPDWNRVAISTIQE